MYLYDGWEHVGDADEHEDRDGGQGSRPGDDGQRVEDKPEQA